MFENLKGLYDVIRDTSARDFLKATPYPSGGTPSSIDIFFNKNRELFYDKIYVDSKEEDDLFQDIDRRIRMKHNNVILISGYKGCGKTTFIHRCMRHLRAKKIRDVFYNFDSYGNSDPIRNTIVRYIFNLIYKDIVNDNGKVCRKWMEVWDNEDNKMFFYNFIDMEKSFRNIFDIIARLLNEHLTIDQKEAELGRIQDILFTSMSISNVLVITIFFDIILQIVSSCDKECVMVFDNLDVIYNTTQIEKFTKECSQFFNDAQYIFRNIVLNEKNDDDKYNSPLRNYFMVFVMRETTNAMFIEHFNDRNLIGHPIDVSNIYDKSKIIKNRCDFVLDNKREILISDNVAEELNLIKDIFKDDYIESYVFKLFNDDIRTGVNAITEITFNDNHLKESISIRKVSQLSSKDAGFASHGIVFFEIFKLFAINGYFNIIKNTEYFISSNRINNNSSSNIGNIEIESNEKEDDKEKSDVYAINISRIILLYLFNSKRDLDDNQTTVSICKMYDDLSKLAYRENGNIRDFLDIVNLSLLDLFNLRKCEYWNHLITFDGLDCMPDEELNNQLDKYLTERFAFRNYGAVRITLSGYMYLNTVLTHFEYFSARKIRTEHYVPLFLAENLNLCSSGLYVFEKIINAVWWEVEKCWEKLIRFYREVFVKQCGYREVTFLGSKFVYHNPKDEYIQRPLFHIERIAHAHISYLDAFRMYAFAILDSKSDTDSQDILDEKKIVNQRVIEKINKYISLISSGIDGDKVVASLTSLNLIKSYNKCIEKISNAGEWDDFETRIDNVTGQALLLGGNTLTGDNTNDCKHE